MTEIGDICEICEREIVRKGKPRVLRFDVNNSFSVCRECWPHAIKLIQLLKLSCVTVYPETSNLVIDGRPTMMSVIDGTADVTVSTREIFVCPQCNQTKEAYQMSFCNQCGDDLCVACKFSRDVCDNCAVSPEKE